MSADDVNNEGNNAETLAEQLAQANARIAQISDELDGLQIEQKVPQALSLSVEDGAFAFEAR